MIEVNEEPQLGCGLIGIGREWGKVPSQVPDDAHAQRFLEAAFQSGIKHYDTAPSYGESERRLGLFLGILSAPERRRLTIATKFGEQWDPDRGMAYIDHTLDGMRRSIDVSLQRLGQVDLLQLHKTTPEVLQSVDLERTWEYALSCGITMLGASVVDDRSARTIITGQQYSALQLPLNSSYQGLQDVVVAAKQAGKLVIINRPFNTGGLQLEAAYRLDPTAAMRDAFLFLLQLRLGGVVLTGTKSVEHLYQNIEAFEAAKARIGADIRGTTTTSRRA